MTKKTPLFDAHNKLGGKVVEFAGYYLPIQYSAGIIAEHNAVRTNVGMFDVSHMGEFEIVGDNACAFLNYLLTNEFDTLQDGYCRYSPMLNDNGGFVDDLIVYRFSADKYWLIVNAGNKEKDAKWISSNLTDGVTFTDKSEEYGQIALQGPNSQKVLEKLTDKIPEENYSFLDGVEIDGVNCVVSRTGYTGEDGFEIYAPAEKTEQIFYKIIEVGKEFNLQLCGLGCRDTLRFEAGMPLYGHELAEDFIASEVGLGFFIKTDKPDFIGKTALAMTPAKYRRRGIKLIDRGIAREHCEIFDQEGNCIGVVTTGTMSPTLGYAIGMVRILKSYTEPFCYVDVRGRKLKAEFVKTPFYKKSIN